MTWSAPKTWADQDTPSATDFNTEIRDNLNALSTHTHSGAAGDGSSIFNSVDHIDFDEGGALSAPASGHTRVAANTDGTLRFRADGGSEKTLSDTTHTHTQASGASNINVNTGGGATPASYGGNGRSVTITPSSSTGSSQYATIIFCAVEFNNANGLSGTYYMNIEKDSSELVEFSEPASTPGGAEDIITGSYVDIAPAASSTVYETDFKESGSVSSNYDAQSMGTREVQCL